MSTYQVQTGDTLSAIAQRELGDPALWPVIYEANRPAMDAAWAAQRDYFRRFGSKAISEPWDYLRVGQTLVMPSQDRAA